MFIQWCSYSILNLIFFWFNTNISAEHYIEPQFCYISNGFGMVYGVLLPWNPFVSGVHSLYNSKCWLFGNVNDVLQSTDMDKFICADVLDLAEV